jgi:DNA end-binding protein Ku
VAVATLVLHERAQLVVIKPNGRALQLAVLHSTDALAPPKGAALPKANAAVDTEELAMVERLIDSMTERFAPEQYTDTYREGLQALIESKREGVRLKTKPPRPRVATEEAELLTALKASIQKAESRGKRALAA